jgi:ergothioneine biosynthesis protein EgtB
MLWHRYEAELCEIGHSGDGFAFDNESPRHRVFVGAFELGSRLVTNGEYLEFIEDGGYRRPELWLSEGWTRVEREGFRAPLYWERRPGGSGECRDFEHFTLAGMQPLCAAEPVSHLSYYEADAFASWAGARLPTEAEWERAAAPLPCRGNFLESDWLEPRAAEGGGALQQLFGDLWEWTRSAYAPYPGFQPAVGAIGEYNGKFMSNQMVLRGGSCSTSESHMRHTYRNFFPPDARWQWSGLRLARDL